MGASKKDWNILRYLKDAMRSRLDRAQYYAYLVTSGKIIQGSMHGASPFRGKRGSSCEGRIEYVSFFDLILVIRVQSVFS